MTYLTDKPSKLLCVEHDAKTKKGRAKGWLTGILYLFPYKAFGMNICPAAEIAECHAPCLNLAGRGGMSLAQASRLRKTKLFHDDREWFMAQLYRDIEALERKAAREGLRAAVRLNGTSDIDWESITVGNGRHTLMQCFPAVQFYDYTKMPRLPKHRNQHYTFSYSRAPAFQKTVAKAEKLGLNIAVVFRNDLPESFLGRPVVSGDDDDLRFLDQPGLVIGLKAKGPARKMDSPLVVDATGVNNQRVHLVASAA